MGKGKKQFIQPGSLVTQKKTKYERKRDETIKENNTVLKAFGIESTLASLRGSSFPNYTNEKGGATGSDLDDDDDYRLPGDEDDSDDKSLDSFEEVLKMPPSGPTRSQVQLQNDSTLVLERMTRSILDPTVESQVLEMPSSGPTRSQVQRMTRSTSHPTVESQSLLPVVEIQTETVEAPRRGRGISRGLKIQGLVEKSGKLPVPIPQEFCAPVGIYASKLASKIGYEVRTQVPDLSVKSWKEVDEGTKGALYQSIQDQFVFEGDASDVNKAITTRCGRRLSDYTHRLYGKFKKLKETKGEVYARSHPPPQTNLEKWTRLIEKKWTNTDWLLRAEKNANNRNNNGTKITKHRFGSKSLPVRVHEYAVQNNSQMPRLPEFYKSTHFDKEKGQWVDPACKANYEKMKELEAAHNKEGATPLTGEQMSVEVLKKRPGYVKGLGLRPSSSLRTTLESASTHGHVSRLELKIEAQNETIEKLLEANKKQQMVNASMMEFLIAKGYTEPIENAGLLSSD